MTRLEEARAALERHGKAWRDAREIERSRRRARDNAIIAALKLGLGVRETARLAGVSTGAVQAAAARGRTVQ